MLVRWPTLRQPLMQVQGNKLVCYCMSECTWLQHSPEPAQRPEILRCSKDVFLCASMVQHFLIFSQDRRWCRMKGMLQRQKLQYFSSTYDFAAVEQFLVQVHAPACLLEADAIVWHGCRTSRSGANSSLSMPSKILRRKGCTRRGSFVSLRISSSSSLDRK